MLITLTGTRLNINQVVYYWESKGRTYLLTTADHHERPISVEETPEQIDELIKQAMEKQND